MTVHPLVAVAAVTAWAVVRLTPIILTHRRVRNDREGRG